MSFFKSSDAARTGFKSAPKADQQPPLTENGHVPPANDFKGARLERFGSKLAPEIKSSLAGVSVIEVDAPEPGPANTPEASRRAGGFFKAA